MISKIEIVFPVPIDTPKGWEQKLSELVDEICQMYEEKNPGRVMWPFGHGCKPTFIPLTREEELTRGMEFDDSVYQIEVAEREDYKNKNTGKSHDCPFCSHLAYCICDD